MFLSCTWNIHVSQSTSKQAKSTGDSERVKVDISQVSGEGKSDVSDLHLLTHHRYKDSAIC